MTSMRNRARAATARGRTALYRHFDSQRRLLYVGISKNPVQRLGEHYHSSDWTPLIAMVEVEWFPSRSEAEAAEIEAIRSERPKFNTVYADSSPPPVRVPRQKGPIPRLALSPKEAAEALGVCRATVYNLMNSGEIPSVKLGGKRLIRTADLESIVAGLPPSNGHTEAPLDPLDDGSEARSDRAIAVPSPDGHNPRESGSSSEPGR